MQQKIEKITDLKEPFTTISVSRKMLYIKDVGRFCACGCQEIIIGPPHKKYASPKHKDDYRYKLRGKRNTKSVQAYLSINVNYDGTRNLTLWFKKGVKKEMTISRNNCVELWNTLNQICEFRNRI